MEGADNVQVSTNRVAMKSDENQIANCCRNELETNKRLGSGDGLVIVKNSINELNVRLPQGLAVVWVQVRSFEAALGYRPRILDK